MFRLYVGVSCAIYYASQIIKQMTEKKKKKKKKKNFFNMAGTF